MHFDKIVKKISKMSGKTLSLEDLWKLIAPGEKTLSPKTRRNITQAAYRLRSQGTLQTIRRGLWQVVSPGLSGKNREEGDIESRYWGMLYTVCQKRFGNGGWMIAGKKALELRMRDFSVPSEITLLVREKRPGKIRLFPGYTVQFRCPHRYASSGKTSLFSALFSHGSRLDLEGVSMQVCGVEHAFLEYFTGPTRNEDGHFVARSFEKFQKRLSREIFGELARMRYIIALNRLKNAAKQLEYMEIYKILLETIKKEGKGVFVSR